MRIFQLKFAALAAAFVSLCAAHAAAQEIWKPKASDRLSWQWQISSVPATNELLAVDMYDVDLFNAPKATLDEMRKRGIKSVCYFSAGTYEGWRSDWKTHFPFITGNDYTGNEKPFLGNMSEWDERWLDVREIELLKPIMTARLKLAKEKGCDAVEPDNMDSYTNASEVKPVGAYTAAHQLAYNKAIAAWAHEQGLSVALKNDVDQLDELAAHFDFAVNEQCWQYNECAGYKAFTDLDKAVFGVEYTGDTASFCPKARTAKLSWLKKRLDLGAYREACNDGQKPVALRSARELRGAGRGEGTWRDGIGRRVKDDARSAPVTGPGEDRGAHTPRYFLPKDVGEK